MICLYDLFNENFDKNGNVVLTPLECSHTQVAAGKYDLTIKHPLDKTGKWMHLVPEAIIRAPIPEETIETAYTGVDVDAYKVTASSAPLRATPSAPQPIYYGAWVSGATYSVGAKCTYNSHNYQCSEFDESSGYIMVPPPNSPWWFEIPVKWTSGGTVLANLKQNYEVYYISGPSSGWYNVATPYGLEGYVQSSQLTYSRHLSPSETQPRHITTQLFRVKTVNVDTKSRTITATAEHVSNDMQGVLVEDVKIAQMSPANALARIESQAMMDYRGTIATNMTSASNGTYTGKINGKNLLYCLLDPDKGIVSGFDAAYRRDNWDVFVMQKTNTDRGFRLRYRKNMLGVSWNIKSDGLVTRVVPVAKDADGNELYLEGTRWVDSQYINNYPVIYMERIKINGQVGKDDGTDSDTKWTAESLRAEMRRKAEERFSIDKADRAVHEITIDFEMLGDTEEYQYLRGLEEVLMYDTVIAINEEIQMSVSVEVTEIEYDAIRKKITALKLTNVDEYGEKNVSGFNVFNNSVTGDKLTDDAGDEIVEEAVDKAAEYTDKKAAQTLSQSKGYTDDVAEETLESSKDYTSEYVGSTHGYGSFEAYIKAYCDGRYVRQ